MWWALLAVIVLIAAFKVPRFGKALLWGIVVVAAIGGTAWAVYDARTKAEARAARTRIRADEVELADLRLGLPRAGDGIARLTGRVRNGSAQYSVTELTLMVTLRDCLEADSCEVVGESTESIYLTIPPRQARDLDEYVFFSDIGEPRGSRVWNYFLVEVQGK